MEINEYKQFRAYTNYDGIYLAILWLASFACTVLGSVGGFLAAFGNLLLLSTPFFVAYRVKKYRDNAQDGRLSFSRAFLYCCRVFLGGALLFSVMQWIYMKFIDGGRLLSNYQVIMNQPEMNTVLKIYGLTQTQLNQAMQQMFSPTFLASYSFIMATIAGAVLSLIIAAIMKRDNFSTHETENE